MFKYWGGRGGGGVVVVVEKYDGSYLLREHFKNFPNSWMIFCYQISLQRPPCLDGS